MAEILPPVKKLIVSSARKDLSSKTPKVLQKFVLRLATNYSLFLEKKTGRFPVGFELMATTTTAGAYIAAMNNGHYPGPDPI